MPELSAEAARARNLAHQKKWMSDPANAAKARARKVAKAREYRAADPVAARERGWRYQIWTLYRMRPEEYFRRLELQGGVCKYCKTDKPGGKWNRFCIDHDHGKPIGEGNRALLCHRCNVMVSMARDRPEVLRAASDDLERGVWP